MISDYIPAELLERIKRYLRVRGNGAHGDYPDNQADEDSITGALGSRLRRDPATWSADGQSWLWKISSKKFIGKGPRAQETVIGADSIIEFTLETLSGQSITKSLLIQAKKDGSLQRLMSQVSDMESVAPGCSAIIDYSEGGYRALDGADYLAAGAFSKRLTPRDDGQQLGDYLADEFIGCHVGVAGMSFDAVRGELHVPKDRVGSISVSARFRDRIRITTVGPVKISQ